MKVSKKESEMLRSGKKYDRNASLDNDYHFDSDPCKVRKEE